MSDVLSKYLGRLTTSGEPPDRASYNEAREHLRTLLVIEMRRRGLWTSLPGFVGVTASSWQDDGALEELVSDAYTYIFLRRLQGLTTQLKVRPNIHGLVVRNVRNFLTDRQSKADPLGYRIFNRLRGAVELLIGLGRLTIHGWTPKDGTWNKAPRINNATVLTFSHMPTLFADIVDLRSPTRDWNNRRMPDLVTAEGRAVPKVVQQLAEDVATLAGDGVQAFCFQHLAKALKDDARSRWHSLWCLQQDTAPEDGHPGASLVPFVIPDEVPDWQRFRTTVLDCVEQNINAIRQTKRQRDLWQVWLFLRSTRINTDEPDELPSCSELSCDLSLPRDRVSQLLGQLKHMVHHCFESAGAGPVHPVRAYADRNPVLATEAIRELRRLRS